MGGKPMSPNNLPVGWGMVFVVALWIGFSIARSVHSQEIDRYAKKQELWTYLEQKGLDELAAAERLAACENESDPVRQFQLSFAIAKWLDRQLIQHGQQTTQQMYPWLAKIDQSQVSGDVIAFVRNKYRFSEAASEVMRGVFQAPESHSDLLRELDSLARDFRTHEERFQNLQRQLRQASASVESAQLRELLFLCQSNIAWCYYYQWLLRPDWQASDELASAQTGLMELLAVSEPDLRGTLPFRWYDGTSANQRRSLLGLGLVLTARGNLSAANTCLATLQQDANPQQAGEVVFLQWLTYLRLRDWKNAKSLQSSFLNGTTINDRATRLAMIRSMWRALHGSEASGDADGTSPARHADYSSDQPPLQDLAGDLILNLVDFGEVDMAADWQQQWPVLPPGSRSLQILKLHSAIKSLGLEGQAADQLNSLTMKLEELSSNPSPGIRRWALDQLRQVYQLRQDLPQLIAVMEREFQLVEGLEHKQAVAMSLGQLHQRLGQSSEARLWLERVRTLDSETPTADQAELELKLLAPGITWQQRLSVLENAVQNPTLRDHAGRQLLGELYQAWARTRNEAANASLEAKLERHLSRERERMLGDGTQIANPSSIALIAMSVNLWESQLQRSHASSEDSLPQHTQLIHWFDRVYAATVDDGQLALDPGTTGLLPLLIKALPYWDQRQDWDKVIAVRRCLDLDWLDQNQQYLLLNYVTRARERNGIDQADDQLAEDLIRLLELLETSQEPGLRAAVWPVRSQFLRVLRVQGRYETAIQWIASLDSEEAAPVDFEMEQARLLQGAEKWKLAEAAWTRATRQLLAGSTLWFESQLGRISSIYPQDPDRARLELAKIKQLYPDLDPIWHDAFNQLNAKWNGE